VNSNYAVAMEDVLMKGILQTNPMLIDAFAIPVSIKYHMFTQKMALEESLE